MFELTRITTSGILAVLMSFGTSAHGAVQDGGAGIAEDLEGFESDEFDTFNIQVQDTELVKVLEMLALQAERNIIPSRNVAAIISVNLFDVTFDEALDAILTPNGFAYEESDNGKFIYVFTQIEIQRKRELERQTEARMFELEHLSAADAAEFAKPLLSERGKLSFIGDVEGGIERDFSNMGRDNWAHSALLVVNDYAENLTRISELLEEIDTPPQQVVVDATIASVSVAEDDGFGVDFSVIGNIDYTALLNPLSAVNDLLRGYGEVPAGFKDPGTTPVYQDGSNPFGVVSSPGDVQNGPSNFKVGVMAGDASIFIRALDQVTDTMILARPRLMALNRQRAQVLVGKRVAFLSTTSTDTTTTQTVQYLDTGIKLMFRPFISRDGSIRMELYPSISEYERVQITGGFEGMLVPDETTSELTTNVRMHDGETLVLGGLFKERTNVTNSQVPFLGDIPIVGSAFSGYNNTVKREEIIFLITPNIVHDDLIRRSGDLGKDFVRELRVGMREGLLPWSRERRSGQHNQDALEAINEGDYELALFHIDNSLRLNGAQPKIRRLRQEINQESELDYYDSDMWSSALESMIEEHREGVLEQQRLNPDQDPLVSGDVPAASQVSEEPAKPVAAAPVEEDPVAALLAGMDSLFEMDEPSGEFDAPMETTTQESAPETTAVAVAMDSTPEPAGFGDVMDEAPVDVAADEDAQVIAGAETEAAEPIFADDRLAASSAGLNSLPFGDPMIEADEPVDQVNAYPGHHRMISYEHGFRFPIPHGLAAASFPEDRMHASGPSGESTPDAPGGFEPSDESWNRLWQLAGAASEQATAFSRSDGNGKDKAEARSDRVANVGDEDN